MDIKQLRAFQAVARTLHFHRAAHALHYAPSSISVQIRTLEDDLGVPLFERLGRRVALTEAGERLLPYAVKLVELLEEARAEVAGASEARGTLTLRVPESLLTHRLPLAIRRFGQRFPLVTLRCVTCAHESLADDLRKGVTDLAFLLAEGINAADLRVEALGEEELRPIVGPGHRLANRDSIAPEDLEGEPLLLTQVDCSYRRVLERLLDEAGVRTGPRLELNSVAALKRCVALGTGVSVAPLAAVSAEVARGELAAPAWSFGPCETGVLMVWHAGKWLSPTLTAFMALVRGSVAEAQRHTPSELGDTDTARGHGDQTACVGD